MGFDGKVVLVTGAASGMGRLGARRMAAAGKTVAAIDINETGLGETAEGRETIHPRILDVTDAEAVRAVVDEIERDLGPIDRVYNAAAIMPTGLLVDQDLETIHRIMAINYSGVVNVAMTTLPRMLERGHGDQIIFASMAGWTPVIHFGAYNASKFAVVAFSEVLYHENRNKGVRFCCVCPPPVATPLLEQAESKPKILGTVPPIAPDSVLDAIESCLDRGKFFVFPGRGTRVGQIARRLLPGRVWAYDHKVEGL